MSTLDEITKEKQRISEALARVDTQRERLTSQLSELEATERVLARYSKGTPTTRRTASTRATGADTPARGRGRPRTTTAGPAAGERTSPSLGDQILALATGKTATASSTPHRQRRRSNAPRSDARNSVPPSALHDAGLGSGSIGYERLLGVSPNAVREYWGSAKMIHRLLEPQGQHV